MIKAVLVFGVLAALSVAELGRISSFGSARRGFHCYARGHACFKNASQESPVDRVTEYAIVRLLKNSLRNATINYERRQRETNQSGAGDPGGRSSPLFDFGFRRGGGRGGRRICPEANQTIFFETLSEVQNSVLAEAPTALANYNTSAASSLLTEYFLCLEATQFDEDGRIVVA